MGSRAAIGAAVLLSLLLMACNPARDDSNDVTGDGGPAGSPGGGSPGAAAGGGFGGEVAGDIFVFGFASETGDVVSTSRTQHFNELFPDVTVESNESGFNSQEFLAALSGSDPPDVVVLPRNDIGTYIASGVLMPLEDCVEEHGLDTGLFYESAMAQVTVDGTLYGLPNLYNTRHWVVTDPVFEAAGYDPAEFDFSDWDAIAEANAAIAQLDGDTLTRIGIDPKIPEFFPMWVHANGGRVISEDGLESLLDTPEVVEALEYTIGLIEEQGGGTTFTTFRGSADYGDPFGAENQIVNESLGAQPWEQWYLNVLADNSPEVDITVRPFVTRDGEPMTLQDGEAWGIIEGTDNPAAACAWVVNMVTTDAWVAAAEARAEQRSAEGQPSTGVYPANREAMELIFSDIVDLSEFPQFEQAVQVVLENQEQAFGFPPSPAAEEFRQAMEGAIDAALTGTDPAEALAAADQEAQAAIDAAAGQ